MFHDQYFIFFIINRIWLCAGILSIICVCSVCIRSIFIFGSWLSAPVSVLVSFESKSHPNPKILAQQVILAVAISVF